MTDDQFVRYAQKALKDRGLYHGAIDGVAGDWTCKALIAALGPIAPTEPGPVNVAKSDFDERSLRNLVGVHDDLVAVMQRALVLSPIPFIVIEGLRTIERQRQLVSQGASKTMRSRHLTGHAVDIVPLRTDGTIAFDWPLYHKLAPAVKQAAEELGVDVEWGGDWATFKDGPHFQLSWASYPA